MKPRNMMTGDTGENSIMQTISIAVSAILIAAGLITAPSLINNARDVNAKQDLANISYMEEWVLGNVGTYTPSVKYVTTDIKLTVSDSDLMMITNVPASTCYSSFTKSQSANYFYRTSESTTSYKVPTVWPATAPSWYPSACIWPSDPKSVLTASGNLVTVAPVSLGGATAVLTSGVAYGGDTWTRIVNNGIPGYGVRQLIDLTSLTNGSSYTAQWEVANDGPVSIPIEIDWSDSNTSYYTIAPGERKVINTTGARAVYDATYRFTDMGLFDTGGNGLLFRQVIVKLKP